MIGESEWLKSLKPGDEVAVATGYRCDCYAIKQIDHVTQTQIVIGHNRYRVKDGHKCGKSSYYSSWIERPTERILAKIRAAELTRIISALPYTIKREAIEKADTSTIREATCALKQVVKLFASEVQP